MYYTCSLIFRHAKHDYDTAMLDSNVPPAFTLPLIDQVKRVGETLELTVTGKTQFFRVYLLSVGETLKLTVTVKTQHFTVSDS